MIKYCLVLIDLQEDFYAANNLYLLENVQKEIVQAVKNNNPIIFVEYEFHSPTIESLTNLTKNYNNKFTIVKDIDDGGEILAKLIINNSLPSTIRICGVNTDYCVAETVKGFSRLLRLNKRKYRIQIVGKACNSFSKRNHLKGLSRLSRFVNVKIIKRNYYI